MSNDAINSVSAEDLLLALNQYPSGISTKELQKVMNCPLELVAKLINKLSQSLQVELITYKDSVGVKAYTLKEFNTIKSLSTEQRQVFLLIRSTQKKGSWLKDMKQKLGLHQTILTQVLKYLESQQMIKTIKSVKSLKKIYVLFELEPDLDTTGGCWYTDQTLDVEFITTLSSNLYKYISSQTRTLTALECRNWMNNCGITSVKLSLADMEQLLDTLWYDYKIERLINTTVNDSGRRWDEDEDDEEHDPEGKYLYRALPEPVQVQSFTNTPCGNCTLFQFCRVGGPVEPKSCEYYQQWLEKW